MCTAMLYDPIEKQKEFEEKMKKVTHKATLLERIENAIRKGLEKFEQGERIKVKGERFSLLHIRANKRNR
jgi:exonuclease VII small subunit